MSTFKGDKSEHVVLDKVNGIVKNASILPFYCPIYDIIYELDDGRRGIQVKTMYKSKSNSFGLNHVNHYDREILLVGINEEYNLAIVFMLFSEIKVGKSHNITVTHTPRSKYWNYFVTLDKLSERLKTYINKPGIIDDLDSIYTDCQLKEKNSTNRFLRFCLYHNLDAILHHTTGDATDVIVNGKKCQLKYASKPENRKRTYSYKITLGRKISGYRKNGLSPYFIEDNDFYIIELGNDHGKFLIIHESIMIEKGIIKTNDQPRRISLSVYPENYSVCNKFGPKCNGNWTNKSGLWYDDNRKWDIIEL